MCIRDSCWKKYGEGKTQSAKGSFTDNDATTYVASDIRFTTKDLSLIHISYTIRNNCSTLFSCSSIHLHPSSLVSIKKGSEFLILTIK